MQIFIKNPLSGVVTVSYTEEPKQQTLSKEQQEKDDSFWDDMMNSIITHNTFMHTIIESFWLLDDIHFSETWATVYKQYVEYKKSSHDNQPEDENIHYEFEKSFLSKFIESIDNKNNQKSIQKNPHKVLDVWKTKLNPDLFSLLLWQMDFKKQSLIILETMPSDITEELYTNIYNTFVKNFRDNKLPLRSSEKEHILSEEKINFLQIQKQYCTFKKLSNNLINKNIKTKYIKI